MRQTEKWMWRYSLSLRPTMAGGIFGYFGSFLGRKRLRACRPSLLAAEASEFNGMRVLGRINNRCRIGVFDLPGRDVNNSLGELVRVARSSRSALCHGSDMTCDVSHAKPCRDCYNSN